MLKKLKMQYVLLASRRSVYPPVHHQTFPLIECRHHVKLAAGERFELVVRELVKSKADLVESQDKLKTAQSVIGKYRKRLQRYKNTGITPSPATKVRRLTSGLMVTPILQKTTVW